MDHFNHYLWSKKFPSYVLMMFGRMVFCPIVGIVELAGAPVNAELFLAFSDLELMELHVHFFCLYRLHFAIDDTVCHGVVGF